MLKKKRKKVHYRALTLDYLIRNNYCTSYKNAPSQVQILPSPFRTETSDLKGETVLH